VPGAGRHEKRWQDVVELLEADISVIATVNVQHIESLADVVADLTGTPVRERVPDALLRQADQIELVDSSPEQLRRRMLHGNIYPPARINQALSGFFQTPNLIALRELTLRFLADDADDIPPGRPRDIAERVVVGVTAGPGTEGVVRRAGRIATRLQADLHVVHVRPADNRRRAQPASLEAVRQLAQCLGAHWIELDDDDPARAIMRVAADQQATQIVLGPSRRSRWRELLAGGSTVRRLTRLAGPAGIDVHIVAGPDPGRPDEASARSLSPRPGAEPEPAARQYRS